MTASAVWYNPAGLGGIQRSKIDISASAFSLTIRRMPSLLVTQLESDRLGGGVEAVDINSIPTGLVFVRSLNERTSLGVGIIMPVYDSFAVTSTLSASTTFPEFPGRLAEYQQRLELAWERSTYYGGVAIGWAASSRLRFGAALFITLGIDDERFLSFGEGHDAATGDDQRFSLRQSERNATAVGARAVVGLQWNPLPRVSLGLVVRSPALSNYQWVSVSSLTDITTDLVEGEDGFSFEETNLDGPGLAQVAPWRINLSWAYHFDRGWLSVEGDVQTPLENITFDIDRDWTWNLRVGLLFTVTDTLSMGGGVFTDIAGERAPTQVGQWRVDYYGGTYGIELRTPIHVRRRERERSEPLVFTTTLALSTPSALARASATISGLVGAATRPSPPS